MPPNSKLITALESILKAQDKLEADRQAKEALKRQLLAMGFLNVESVLQFIQKLPRQKGDRGENGKDGISIKGDPGVVGKNGKDGVDGKNGVDGTDGKDAEVNSEELLALSEMPMKKHEMKFDHTLIHNSFLLGDKILDESNLEDGVIIQYSKKEDKWVLVKMPKKVQQPMLLTGGSSTSTKFRDKTVTTSTTLDPLDQIIYADATSGNITLTLPSARGNQGTSFKIKKIDSSDNLVTVVPFGTETIEGDTSFIHAVQYAGVTVVSNGSNWLFI
jgi:hypothetical protein